MEKFRMKTTMNGCWFKNKIKGFKKLAFLTVGCTEFGKERKSYLFVVFILKKRKSHQVLFTIQLIFYLNGWNEDYE